jgi:hypothetical protein
MPAVSSIVINEQNVYDKISDMETLPIAVINAIVS